MAKEDCGKTLYDLHCKSQFEVIHYKLDKLYSSINGNGQPGLKMETDRNTRWICGITRVLWVIVTAIVGVIAWLIRGQF